jgi:phosphatidylglycerophosphate synthase
MRTHTDPAIGLIGQLLVLGALAASVGLGAAGWLVGVGCGAVTSVLLARALVRHGRDRLGPADWVTLARVTLAAGVAALTADVLLAGSLRADGPLAGSVLASLSARVPASTVPAVVVLTVVALVLDGVDGQVARRTRTVSTLGGTFDGEADAFLILVLSAYVAPSAGAWVLVIGVARYGFLAAGWVLPWMLRTLPHRYWRKVVTAVVGVSLVSAVPDVLPPGLTAAALAVSLALIVESFGRDVVWLWQRRQGDQIPATPSLALEAADLGFGVATDG